MRQNAACDDSPRDMMSRRDVDPAVLGRAEAICRRISALATPAIALHISASFEFRVGNDA
jgi:hypothetical protein